MNFKAILPEDIDQLTAAGFATRDIQLQLELLSSPPPAVHLLRPCTLGDGLIRLAPEAWEPLEANAASAASAGRFAKFVPASGAATRMFGSLLAALNQFGTASWDEIQERSRAGDGHAKDVLTLISELRRMPFFGDLKTTADRTGESLQALIDRGAWRRILELLLTDTGLGMAHRPKALVPFHHAAHGNLTAFEEQIEEGLLYLRDRDQHARYYFTVAPSTMSDFSSALEEFVETRDESFQGVQVRFSEQSERTGTLSLTEEGELLRNAAGAPRIRPGGHGALLVNLQETQGELVHIRNIDNVLPAGERRDDGIIWQRRLGGLLASLTERAHQLVFDLKRPNPTHAARMAARELLVAEFSGRFDESAIETDAGRQRLIQQLDRPIRVCGMVPNTGEPGGGPFWVEGPDGATRQIVEGAQIDLDDPDQAAIWRSSSHFNPVNIVCCLKDCEGEAYPLDRFADPRTVIVSRKMIDGRPARVLERPGLWNGGMAHWNSVFVEIPGHTFAPVKTVFDLLRPEHQTSSRA